MGFSVAIPSRQLSPSGSVGRCSQPPRDGAGKHVPCYTGSWGGPGRHSHKRVTSAYTLRRSRSLQLSIPGHSSAPSISHVSTHTCVVRPLHQLCRRLLQAGRVPSRPPPSYPRSYGMWLPPYTPDLVAGPHVWQPTII